MTKQLLELGIEAEQKEEKKGRKKKTPCEKCPLYGQKADYFVPTEVAGGAAIMVPGQDPLAQADLLIVGEAPGQMEAFHKRPFVGDSGRVLRGLVEPMAEALNRRVAITNAVKCWPGPGNPTPPAKAVLLCREAYLDDELKRFGGEKIVAVGASATHAFHRRVRRLKELIGHPEVDLVPGKKVLSTWHPAYYLRRRDRQLKSDIARALLWGLHEDARTLGPRTGIGCRDDESATPAA